MSPILFAILALSASPSDASAVAATPAPITPSAQQTPSSPSSTKQAPSPRAGAELREAVHLALRHWAQPSDTQADAAAREFLAIYKDLQADKQLSSSQREYLMGKTRAGWRSLASRSVGESPMRSDWPRPSAARSTQDATSGSTLNSPSGTGESGSAVASTARAGAFGGAGVGPSDSGQDLVDLIQTVIRPASWDVNGGNGSIYYWYPGKCPGDPPDGRDPRRDLRHDGATPPGRPVRPIIGF
jgi:hypothetical protein